MLYSIFRAIVQDTAGDLLKTNEETELAVLTEAWATRSDIIETEQDNTKYN